MSTNRKEPFFFLAVHLPHHPHLRAVPDMRPSFYWTWVLALLLLEITAFCTTPSDTIMAHNVSAAEQLQTRSASQLKAGLRIPWPAVTRNGRKLRVIKYCFADFLTRSRFECLLQDAFTLWAEGLGFPAGQVTGHSISWEEAHNRNPNPSQRRVEYCYKLGSRDWNDNLDKDTLRISINDDPNTGSYATVGYRIGSRYTVGSHYMVLERSVDAKQIAHEVSLRKLNQSVTN
jgi:hypothetical protein